MIERSTSRLVPSLLDPQAVEQAAALIMRADALVVAAGAGMGVDSGLPDFRGNAGFWRAYPTLAASGTTFRDIASPPAFASDPRRAWGFYGHRLSLYRSHVPHAGFDLLRQWGETMPRGAFVFTSNVDGHFQRAKFDPARIDECHGSIHHLQCTTPCCEAIWPAAFDPVVDGASCTLVGALPLCPHCGRTARPNILMFDDWNWIDARREAQSTRCRQWLEDVRRPVVIEIGAGLNVKTVRHFSQRVVLQHNGTLIRINPREPHNGHLPSVALASNALPALDAIGAVLRAKHWR
jgi:NAD-dependent SIR2 family protein deacetylase